MTPMDTARSLKGQFPEITDDPVEFRGEVSLVVPARSILACMRWLKDVGRFDMLTDLCGIDDLGREPRYGVDYNLYSFTHRIRLRVRTAVPSEAPELDSVTTVWRAADWHERETFDMYGIRFRGHPNLTRILMWDGYPYFPLRKDFPLAGLPAELPSTAVDAGTMEAAPMEGGPFVPGVAGGSIRREPHQVDTLSERDQKLARPNREEPV